MLVQHDAPPAARCSNCGVPLAGRWCHACGEERFAPEDRRFAAFVARLWEAATDFDSKFYRSLLGLVRRPGALTADYLAGRRRAYVHPLRLFLLINVIYFFGVGIRGYNTFSTPLEVHWEQWPYKGIVREVVQERVGPVDSMQEIPLQFRQRFNRLSERLARTLVIALIPLAAFVLMLAHVRRRRYFADHVVLATHFIAFVLGLLTALGFLAAGFARQAPGSVGALLESDAMISLALLVIIFLYLSSAFRRVYGGSDARNALLALAVAGPGMIVIVNAYRFLLFWVVLLFV